jgi:small subunit ribosomal protein S5
MAITPQVKEFDEKVISIDRVARVVKGGRRFRFRAAVVIGDGRGRVGVGIGKGGEVMTSIAKAVAKAKRSMITVPMSNATIPHEVEVRFSGARVMLKPASAGTGVIAGGAVRNVVEAAGIHDLLTKSLGSSNKVNNAYATIVALSQLKARPARPQRHKPTSSAADAPAKPEAAKPSPKASDASKSKKAKAKS